MAACLRMVVMWFVHLCSFGPFAVVCRLFRPSAGLPFPRYVLQSPRSGVSTYLIGYTLVLVLVWLALLLLLGSGLRCVHDSRDLLRLHLLASFSFCLITFTLHHAPIPNMRHLRLILLTCHPYLVHKHTCTPDPTRATSSLPWSPPCCPGRSLILSLCFCTYALLPSSSLSVQHQYLHNPLSSYPLIDISRPHPVLCLGFGSVDVAFVTYHTDRLFLRRYASALAHAVMYVRIHTGVPVPALVAVAMASVLDVLYIRYLDSNITKFETPRRASV